MTKHPAREARGISAIEAGDRSEFDVAHEPPSNRHFGVVIALALAVVALLVGWDSTAGLTASIGSACLLATAVAKSSWLSVPNRLWTRFGLLLGKLTNPIVLAALYFLVLTPTGLARRALRKDSLRLTLDPHADTYWIHREPGEPRPESMTRQF